MSSINVRTSDLVHLLAQLIHTSSKQLSEGPTAAILLHTVRGERGEEPGTIDLLVGTSTDRTVIGHTNTYAHGQLHRATLWHIDDARAVVASFRPKLKNDKDHHVAIQLEGDKVTVAAEDDLLEEGFRLTFAEASISDYPRYLWRRIRDISIAPEVLDPTTKRPIPVSDRTDVGPGRLAPFVKVAGLIGSPIELYRSHQNLPILVQIGHQYRGALMPVVWDDGLDRAAGEAPSAEVYAPDLPPVPPKQAEDNEAVSVLRAGHGVILGAVKDIEGHEPLPEFPDLDRDPSLLLAAAELVVTTQFASASMIQRKLRIGFARASSLLEQLEERGLVGPRVGTKTREMLVRPEDLPAILDGIRGPEAATEPDEDDTGEPKPRFEVREHDADVGGVAGFGVYDNADDVFFTWGWTADEIDEQLARANASPTPAT